MSRGRHAAPVVCVAPLPEILAAVDPFSIWTAVPVLRTEIEAVLSSGLLEHRPWHLVPHDPSMALYARRYHAARIGWFVAFPDPSPIRVLVRLKAGKPFLDVSRDGHRLAAAAFLGQSEASLSVSGEIGLIPAILPGADLFGHEPDYRPSLAA